MARRPAADAGITVAPNPNRVIVRLGGAIVADTTRALVMRAPGTPDQQYIPRADVDMTRLVRTAHVTHCPYKGGASYWSIQGGPRTVENAVWSYETPHDDMASISGYLAFYANRVDAIEERPPDPPR
jgi:uncharacterized protein (DUF427 family)